MTDPLAPLATEPDRFIFIDVETRSSVDVTVHGAYRHTRAGRVTIFVYAIGDGPVQEWLLEDWSGDAKLDWADAPPDLAAALKDVQAGRKWFVAWNAFFEACALTHAMRGLVMRPEWLLDAMVQATRSHLPGDLFGASQVAKVKAMKHADGKRLIKKFAVADSPHTPQTDPEDWAAFRAYARDDINSMREIFWGTMPLSRRMWEEYWASERINHRGLPLDVPFVEAAARLADFASARANDDVKRLSGGVISTVNQAAVMTDWVRDKLWHIPDVDRILTREVLEEPTEDGEDVRQVPKYSLERNRVEELIALLERRDQEMGLTDDEWAVLQLLEVRLYGAGSTPKKFAKARDILDMGEGSNSVGWVRGSYAFAGAAATTRYSSRGLQTHNLKRVPLSKKRPVEIAAIETITDNTPADAYTALAKAHGNVNKVLAHLIRPAVVTPVGKTFVWSDWSAIEARALPWLANSHGADRVLDVFRQNDADPSLPDVYKVQAGEILAKDAHDVTDEERQSHGKVPVLSLGYAGGKGALFNMARIYRAHFTEDEATDIIAKWRSKNKWAMDFADDLWDAALWCIDNPGEGREAGRVTFTYDPGYLRGTLFMVLPDGTWLAYPSVRWEDRETKDKTTGKVRNDRVLTFRKGRGRSKIWKGSLANNATQGTAACLLRNVIRVMEQGQCPIPADVVGHTHDEVITMCDERHADEVAAGLADLMRTPPDWAEGLPLAVEATICEFYTKTAEK